MSRELEHRIILLEDLLKKAASALDKLTDQIDDSEKNLESNPELARAWEEAIHTLIELRGQTRFPL